MIASIVGLGCCIAPLQKGTYCCRGFQTTLIYMAVEREREAYCALHPQLVESHLGKYVAIYTGCSAIFIAGMD